MISYFHHIGLWRPKDDDKPSVKELGIKLFYCIWYTLYPISLIVGVFTGEKGDESIFLAEISDLITVLSVKMWILVWQQKEIRRLFNRICIFTIRNHDDFQFVNRKLNKFMRFVTGLFLSLSMSGVCIAVVPFIGSERNIIFKIAFPLDWKNDEYAFFAVNFFLFTQIIFTLTAYSFSIIIWYLMLNCSLRYEVLGNELKNLGVRKIVTKISSNESRKIFFRDLMTSIKSHQQIRE